MKTKIKFRKYESKDYIQIKKNLKKANLYQETKQEVERLVKKDKEAVIVLVDGKKIIGGAFFVDMGIMIMLFRLYVIPEYRKQGFGKLIIDEAKRRAKKRGIKELHLVVHEEQDRLKNWYKQMGAEEEQTYRWFWIKT